MTRPTAPGSCAGAERAREPDRSTAGARSPRPSGGGGRCAASGGRRRPRPRSSSGSAARPTTRASSPRSIPIPTPIPARCSRRRAAWSSRSTRSRTRATSAPSPARPRPPGAAGLVIPERRAAEVTAVTCKASAGAVEHLEIARVRNLADWLAQAKEAGFWIWGADAEADTAPLGRRPQRFRRCSSSAARARGSGRGSPRACDGLVALPRRGRVDSLNVSAAAAALLFEAVQAARLSARSTCNGGCTNLRPGVDRTPRST